MWETTVSCEMKKMLIFHDRVWRGLGTSLAERNESPLLELLRAWEPEDSSRPLPVGEGKEVQFGLPHGD